MLGVAAIQAVGMLEEFFVPALLDDAAAFQDNDTVSVLDGGEPMGDDERRAAIEQPPKSLLDQFLGLGIER